jgi:Helix-turn-helix of DDE superfamily endonuclease
VIAYRAMLDVPRELVSRLAGLLRAERKRRGTRRGSRALSCWRQALLGLVWFRKNEEMTVLAAGFGIGRATAYRYRDEIVTVLAEQAPDLHEALQQVADEGWSHVILDGKVFRTDRCAETTTSTKGKTIHSWYSGKHRAFGGNVQAIMRPDGLPVWTSEVVAGHDHDLTAAREGHVWARCTGPHRNCTCPPWPTGATRAPARACTCRSSGPATATSSRSITWPTTRSSAACAHWANAASPCSPVAGGPYNASLPARPGSETPLPPE